MQRKQQVRECWVCVILFACLCVGMSNMTTVSDDPSSSSLCVVCAGKFPRGSQGGRYAPLGLRAAARIFFFGRFLLLLADF
jgi:hypothetical protein